MSSEDKKGTRIAGRIRSRLQCGFSNRPVAVIGGALARLKTIVVGRPGASPGASVACKLMSLSAKSAMPTGVATARMFNGEGAKIVITDMLEHGGKQMVEAIDSAARFEKLDVTDEENWVAVVAKPTQPIG